MTFNSHGKYFDALLPFLKGERVAREWGAICPYTDMGTETGGPLYELAYQACHLEGNLIEVGVEDGSSTLCILAGIGDYAEDTGIKRTLYSIDKQNVFLAVAAVNGIKLSSFWKLIIKPASEALPSIPSPWSFYFHDAEHGYNDVYNETAMMLPKAVSGAVCLSHDCNKNNPAWRGLDAAGKENGWNPCTELNHDTGIIRKS